MKSLSSLSSLSLPNTLSNSLSSIYNTSNNLMEISSNLNVYTSQGSLLDIIEEEE